MGVMRCSDTPLPGMKIVDTVVAGDARGRFERVFCRSDWSAVRPGLDFVQINLSTTAGRGTIRGFHFQRPPAAEAKLIRCVKGAVFDVAVDLRAGSPTFLRWHAVELRAEEAREVFIPEGFAHGFQALTDETQLLYLHTAPWTPALEGGLRADDPALAVTWPLPVAQRSERDRSHPLIDAGYTGISL
jgi:dTDP-4-dehydrorhamnose 3,5-epimerase